jgi:predicted transcriptional regulator
MSSQTSIQVPSDDPVAAVRILKYRNYVAKVEQYQKNVDDALSWQDVTENALSDLGDVIKRLKELTVQASNGTQTTEDRQIIKEEVNQLKEQAIEIMKENKVDSLMVTDKNNVLIGMVTLKSIQLIKRNIEIEEIMEQNVQSISEDANLISVLTTMNAHKIGYVPVVNQSNQLTGLITRSSILSALSSQLIDLEVAF